VCELLAVAEYFCRLWMLEFVVPACSPDDGRLNDLEHAECFTEQWPLKVIKLLRFCCITYINESHCVYVTCFI